MKVRFRIMVFSRDWVRITLINSIRYRVKLRNQC